MKKNINVIIFYLVIFALIIFVATQLLSGASVEKCTYGQVEDFFESDMVQKFEVTNGYELIMSVYVAEGDAGKGQRPRFA